MENQARASIATGDALDVRSFSVTASMSQLFRVELRVVSPNLDIDFDAVIGQEASFALGTMLSKRSWRGVCIEMDQVRVDQGGLATYTLTIAPSAYLLTQRKNYRIFQFKSELEIVQQVLAEWGVANRAQVDAAAHKPRKFRVQYAESDFNFVSRMLEDAGISFYFEDAEGGTTMVLDDNPQAREVAHPDVRFHDEPGVSDTHFVTNLAALQRVRPGKMTIFDLDYRKASTQQPRLSAAGGLAQESQLEQFDYEPGAFLYQGQGGGSSPHADDRGASRTDPAAGAAKTKNRLHGKRQDARRVSFESSVLDLAPGSILTIADHPAVASGEGLLVTDAVLEGEHDGDWRVHVETAGTERPFRPQTVTPKPRVRGLESATVVGPTSDEIHTDEYARVRVHFHWDRESRRDETSSCWIPTNQPWAGAGFGGTVLPRIGQEVLVEFFGGDPDRPVVVGRVFTEHQPPPYPLPQGKTITGLVGKSTPALIMGSSLDANGIFVHQGAGPSAAYRAKPPPAFGIRETKNAFLLDDQQGGNLTFLQAERDLNILVKNSWKTIVGNYRGCMVGGEDNLYVRNKQHINVMKDQHLAISGNQEIQVDKDREEDVGDDIGLIVGKNTRVDSKGVIAHKAKKHIVIEAGETIVLQVGSSKITITKADITVQSPKVTINDPKVCR